MNKIKNRLRKKSNLLFCSKRCTGLYGKEIQSGEIVNREEVNIVREYYYLDK